MYKHSIKQIQVQGQEENAQEQEQEVMVVQAVVKKWGNSLGVRVPAVFAESAGISDGTAVGIVLTKDDEIIIRRSSKQKFSLEDLLEQVTPENKHGEAFDLPVGKESW